MLTSTDEQLGYPQMALMKRQMNSEVWSTDYYGFNDPYSYADGSEWDSSGTSGTIGEIQARIRDLENTLASKKSALTTAESNYTSAVAQWNACGTSDCRSHHSKSRCNECRKQPDLDMQKYFTQKQALSREISSIQSDISDWEEALAEAQKLAVELVAQGKELAKYGETPESILAKTQSKAKNRRLLLGAGVGIAVLFTGIYIFYKIRKGKKS